MKGAEIVPELAAKLRPDEGGGAVELLTMIEKLLDVAWLPAASRATALSVCAPFAVVVVSQVTP